MSTLEITAAALGILGSLLLASRSRHSAWGWVLFLLSNAAWIAFALQHQHTGLLVMQVVFVATSLLGIWRWLLAAAWVKLWEGWNA